MSNNDNTREDSKRKVCKRFSLANSHKKVKNYMSLTKHKNVRKRN